MKTGDVVMIYSRPMEMKNKEGLAKLVNFIYDDGDLEYWYVEFTDHPDRTYMKSIKTT